MKMSGYILIGLAILSAVGSQLLFKSGIKTIGGFGLEGHWVRRGMRLVTNWQILVGLACYAVGWLAWIMALSRFELSFIYPFTSLNYVLILLFSWLVLDEQISPLRIVGVVIICLGVIISSKA